MTKIFPAVIGLGYVGLPIYLRLIKKFSCVGFDINQKRVNQLKKNFDVNKEFVLSEITASQKTNISNDINKLKKCNFYIVTVPTPIKKNKKPDLIFLENAFKILQKVIKPNDIIFLESTVYPGTTKFLSKKYLKKKKDLSWI